MARVGGGSESQECLWSWKAEDYASPSSCPFTGWGGPLLQAQRLERLWKVEMSPSHALGSALLNRPYPWVVDCPCLRIQPLLKLCYSCNNWVLGLTLSLFWSLLIGDGWESLYVVLQRLSTSTLTLIWWLVNLSFSFSFSTASVVLSNSQFHNPCNYSFLHLSNSWDTTPASAFPLISILPPFTLWNFNNCATTSHQRLSILHLLPYALASGWFSFKISS